MRFPINNKKEKFAGKNLIKEVRKFDKSIPFIFQTNENISDNDLKELSAKYLNKNSKFWTTQNLEKLEEKKFEKIFDDQKALGKELNTNISLNLISNTKKNNTLRNLTNNDGQYNFDGLLKKSSKYKFSKIKNFNQLEPVISFNKSLIFLS